MNVETGEMSNTGPNCTLHKSNW